MTPEQFVMWLRGFFEGRPMESDGVFDVGPDEVEKIYSTLSRVRCGPANPYLNAASPYNDYMASVGSAVLGRRANVDVKKDIP